MSGGAALEPDWKKLKSGFFKQAGLMSQAGQFGNRMHLERARNICPMELYGPLRDPELRGDLLVQFSTNYMAKHLQFTRA